MSTGGIAMDWTGRSPRAWEAVYHGAIDGGIPIVELVQVFSDCAAATASDGDRQRAFVREVAACWFLRLTEQLQSLPTPSYDFFSELRLKMEAAHAAIASVLGALDREGPPAQRVINAFASPPIGEPAYELALAA